MPTRAQRARVARIERRAEKFARPDTHPKATPATLLCYADAADPHVVLVTASSPPETFLAAYNGTDGGLCWPHAIEADARAAKFSARRLWPKRPRADARTLARRTHRAEIRSARAERQEKRERAARNAARTLPPTFAPTANMAVAVAPTLRAVARVVAR